MIMETVCPKCFDEGAYHNGVCYECPDCGYKWGDTNFFDDDNDKFDED